MLISSNAQRVRRPVDIVEPRCNESDLKDSFVVKTYSAKFVMILPADSRCVFGYLDHVIKHDAVLLG